jgi:pSer/pThr/pTyr-binding forkhead associated (FHA) protein
VTGALVVQVDGEDEPRVFTDRFVIGRGISNAAIDLTEDEYVSPSHATCYPAGDGTWIIEDNGSTNGTWAGSVRVYKARLGKGDRLRVGRTMLTFIPAG